MTEAFRAMSELVRKSMGLPDLRVVVIPHPLFDKTEPELRAIAAAVADDVVAALVEP